jgi:hypothetical protein
MVRSDHSDVAVTVYYFGSNAGFTSPTWRGYPAVNMGAATPVATWLIGHGLPYDADLQSDPNGDGVNLLLAYALNLDPHATLCGNLPKPLLAGGQLSLTYFAGNAAVTYTVESSADCQIWNTTDVTMSAQDGNGFRTASVPCTSRQHFLRLAVAVP